MRAALGPQAAPFASETLMIAESGSVPIVLCSPAGYNLQAPGEDVLVEGAYIFAAAYVRVTVGSGAAP